MKKNVLKICLLLNAFGLFVLNIVFNSSLANAMPSKMTIGDDDKYHVSKKCDAPTPSIACTPDGSEVCDIKVHCGDLC